MIVVRQTFAILSIFITALFVCSFAYAQYPLSSSDEVKKITDRLVLKPGKSPNTIKLPIYVLPSASTFFGDWNAIEFENPVAPGEGKDTNVILSVESLIAPPSFKWSKRLNLRSNKSAQGFEVPLPTGKPRAINLYGVFICRDSRGDESCSKKPFEPIESILERYLPNSEGLTTAPPGYAPRDQLYYFSMFAIDQDAILAYKTHPFEIANQKVFERLLTNSYSSKEIALALQYAEERLRVLASVPGEVKRIPIPYSGSGPKLGPYMYWVDLPRMKLG